MIQMVYGVKLDYIPGRNLTILLLGTHFCVVYLYLLNIIDPLYVVCEHNLYEQ